MKSKQIKISKSINFHIVEDKKNLLQIIENLEKSLNLERNVRRIKKFEYEIGIKTSESNTTICIKISLNPNPCKLFIKLPLRKWNPNELRKIQSYLYKKLGVKTANNFIQSSSVNCLQVEFTTLLDFSFNRTSIEINGKVKYLKKGVPAEISNANSKRVILVGNKKSNANTNLRVWTIKLVINPKMSKFQHGQKIIKIAHEEIKISFSLERVKLANRTDEKERQKNFLNAQKLISVFEISMPYSWLSMINLMHKYTDERELSFIKI